MKLKRPAACSPALWHMLPYDKKLRVVEHENMHAAFLRAHERKGMDTPEPLKTRAKAKGKYSNGAPPQTLPQPAAWQKREPPMQTVLNRLHAYERRLKRIINMCDDVSIGLIADAAVDLTRIKEIAEGKHDK